ncbi:RHS repeat-associated core domain-containing protein [Streptomyces bobili]|uniref:RHS repeat-associated core domain-containing protein n=1 Tax=Streptomyces bobili TaxID=67280 RepID=UPI00342BFD0C
MQGAARDRPNHLAAAWAQRTYTAGDAVVAIRSNEQGVNKLSLLAGDHHGTQSLSITADASQTVTKRFMSPFGKDRGGSVGTWGTDKGFLGKTLDKTTGLTHIGARQYDAAIGQFISVDPLLETDKAQTLNGYSYGTQNPLTFSDPTGTRLAECTGGWRECGPGTINSGGGAPPSGGGGETASGGGNHRGGTASGDHGGGDNADEDCGWISWCGVSNAWEDGKKWAVEHREVIAIGTEIAVGSSCMFTAVGTGFVSGGAGFGAAAGCGGISGAAGTAVRSALTPGADDSVTANSRPKPMAPSGAPPATSSAASPPAASESWPRSASRRSSESVTRSCPAPRS